ncbi:cytochrome c oxidase assembly protein COX19-like [Apostichopus japonicus]|uniref:cytochrome c oxidase assembly protein COX19-like n=1 Tax=Stichopus japonicus TaxID=307972 RepID=UPI003AB26CD6
MSTAMNFSQKSFKPKPPDKGSFPLDHEGECRKFKEIYMECIRNNRYNSHKCRMESKQYLECRMDRDLMAKEPLDNLGFGDMDKGDQKTTESKEDKR